MSDVLSHERQRWRAMLTAVLQRSGIADDRDPEAALSHRTLDGVVLKPLYTADDLTALHGLDAPFGAAPYVRATCVPPSALDVRARYLEDDLGRTNRAVLADLAGGVSSIWLETGAGGIGPTALASALAGVDLRHTPVVLGGAANALAGARSLLELAQDRGTPACELSGGAGADPIAAQARTGIPADLSTVAALATLLADTPLIPITVDASTYADAGASDADELAAAAAAGVAYVRTLTDAGIADPFAAMEFRYSVSADQFASIAKLRAARLLWSRIGELCGVQVGQRQHAVTSMAAMTRYDPWLNIVRNTVACLGALAGGAQSITVLPFDAALGRSDEFARRIARNTVAIACEESGLGRVSDPAGGSYYVEALTEQLAQAAWDRFTAIERGGGALSALNSGLTASMLSDSRRQRDAALATRVQPVVGASMFADIAEKPVHRVAAGALPLSVAALSVAPPKAAEPAVGRLPVLRYAEPFERQRRRLELHRETTGSVPRIVLATMGTRAGYGARVGFVQDLLAAAGLATVVYAADQAGAGSAAGPAWVCLCGRDDDYRDHGDTAVQALRAAGATTVYLAGKPGSTLPVDGYLYVGCDAVQTLDQILTSCGVR